MKESEEQRKRQNRSKDEREVEESPNCKKCEAYVNEGIFCVECQRWWHFECLNTPREKVLLLENFICDIHKDESPKKEKDKDEDKEESSGEDKDKEKEKQENKDLKETIEKKDTIIKEQEDRITQLKNERKILNREKELVVKVGE